MRVSIDLNEKAAPLLFRDVVLKDPVKDGFLAKYPNGHLLSMPRCTGPRGRLVSGKKENMRYIRHVTVEEELTGEYKWPRQETDKLFPRDEPKLQIESLAFKLPNANPDEDEANYFFVTKLQTFDGLWDRFQVEKVVVHDPNGSCSGPFLDRLPDDLECLVIRPLNRFDRHCPALKKLIYVLPPGYGDFEGCTNIRGLRSADQRAMTNLQHEWRRVVHDVELQFEIVIVHPGGSDPKAAQRQKNIEAAMKIDRTGREYTGPVKEIRFLTMPEYLSTHDWSGEFTEEEARPWLDLVEVDTEGTED
jgi:hypothetical protein